MRSLSFCLLLTLAFALHSGAAGDPLYALLAAEPRAAWFARGTAELRDLGRVRAAVLHRVNPARDKAGAPARARTPASTRRPGAPDRSCCPAATSPTRAPRERPCASGPAPPA